MQLFPFSYLAIVAGGLESHCFTRIIVLFIVWLSVVLLLTAWMVLTFGIDLLFHSAVFEGNASSRHCLLDDGRITAAFEKWECRKGDIGFDNMLTFLCGDIL